MARGRKPAPKTAPTDVVDLTPTTLEPTAAERMQIALPQAVRDPLVAISKRQGRREMADAIAKLLTVHDAAELKNIKESKTYLNYPLPDGRTIHSWEEYCERIEGKSRDTVDLQIRNLEKLGPELYDALAGIGFGPGKMRDIAALDMDTKTALLTVVESSESVDTLKATVIDALVRHQADKLHAKLLDAQEDLKAKDAVIEAKNKKLDEVHERLHKWKPKKDSSAKTLEEQQQLKELAEAGNAAELSIARLRSVVDDICGNSPSEPMNTAAHNAATYIAQRMGEILVEYGVRAMLEEMVHPHWLKPAGGLDIESVKVD